MARPIEEIFFEQLYPTSEIYHPGHASGRLCAQGFTREHHFANGVVSTGRLAFHLGPRTDLIGFWDEGLCGGAYLPGCDEIKAAETIMQFSGEYLERVPTRYQAFGIAHSEENMVPYVEFLKERGVSVDTVFLVEGPRHKIVLIEPDSSLVLLRTHALSTHRESKGREWHYQRLV